MKGKTAARNEALACIKTYVGFNGVKIPRHFLQELYDRTQRLLQDKPALTPLLLKLLHTIKGQLLKVLKHPDSDFVLELENPGKYEKIIAEIKQGLHGIKVLPLVATGVASELARHAVSKLFVHKDEVMTSHEAKELGVIDDNLSGITKDVYKEINQLILEALEDNKLVYRQPWRDGIRIKGTTYGPQNYVTQRPYVGANAMLILLYNFFNKTRYQYFLTAKQVRERGGKLIKGAKPFKLFAFIETENTEVHPEDTEYLDIKKGIIVYRVYPIEDTKGIQPIKRKYQETDIDEFIAGADIIVAGMPKRPDIVPSRKGAFYTSLNDVVHMPPKKAFDRIDHYYATLFHELVHSTGHKKRIGRDLTGKYGDKKYCFEELVAEIGSAYLCGNAGISYYTLKNSAGYIRHFANELKKQITKDKTFFFRAVYAATKAAKYILSNTLEKKIKSTGKTGKKKKSKKPKAKLSHPKPRARQGKPKPRTKTKAKTKTRSKKKPAGAPRKSAALSKKKAQSKVKTLGSVLSGEEIASMEFNEIPLTGKYKEDFLKLYSDSQIEIDGEPGHGKTVYLLQFAQNLADLGIKVLYVANEEMKRSTLKEKIKKFNIHHPKNLRFVKNLADLDKAGFKIEDFGAVFLDSINTIGMNLKSYRQLVEQHPGRIYVIVLQSTKDGGFRGGKDWEHEVDIAGSIKNRQLMLRKNRYDENFAKKAEAIKLDEQVKKKQQDLFIKQKVKENIYAENILV